MTRLRRIPVRSPPSRNAIQCFPITITPYAMYQNVNLSQNFNGKARMRRQLEFTISSGHDTAEGPAKGQRSCNFV